jgi:hypothetical protein
MGREYEVTLQFEDYKEIKQKLGIGYSTLQKTFKTKFVPALLTEILKLLKENNSSRPNNDIQMALRRPKNGGGEEDEESAIKEREQSKERPKSAAKADQM